ncbi:MAG: hypothetical protein WBO34_01525 [Gammaproteobacteria bacterium]
MNRQSFAVQRLLVWVGLLLITGSGVLMNTAVAKSTAEIDISTTETINRFKREVSGGSQFQQRASGILIFPSVNKAGFVFDNKGLMYNLTLEGSKFTKLNK